MSERTPLDTTEIGQQMRALKLKRADAHAYSRLTGLPRDVAAQQLIASGIDGNAILNQQGDKLLNSDIGKYRRIPRIQAAEEIIIDTLPKDRLEGIVWVQTGETSFRYMTKQVAKEWENRRKAFYNKYFGSNSDRD